MEIYEFKMLMRELCEAFGRKSDGELFDRKCTRYFMRFEKVADDVLRRAFFAAEEHKVFPSLNDILEYVRIEKCKNPVQSFHEECNFCSEEGTITATITEKNKKHKTLFKCPYCSNSSAHYPVWSFVFEERGYVMKKQITWDANDEYQLKGLIVLGSRSTAWQKAPQELREKAIELYNTGWRPKNNLASIDVRL